MPVILKRTAELLPLIMPYAPQCPDFIAEQQIRFAAIEFAERSRCWRHVAELDMTETQWDALLTGTMDQTDYGLLFMVGDQVFRAKATITGDVSQMEAPTLAVIHEIEFAEFNGRKLTPVQFSTLARERRGKPEYITQVSPNSVTIWPYDIGKLTLSMFLKPASASQFGTDTADPMFDKFNVVPDFFITLHGHVLALGALHRILSMPGEPWTDEAKALRYEAKFEEKLNGAFRHNMRGQQRAPIRTPYRDF